MTEDYPIDDMHFLKSGPNIKLRDWRSLPTSELTRGERNCRFIERNCAVPEGDAVGQPVHLAEFQELFIQCIYDNEEVTDTAILSMARKNSKTGLVAFIALIHIVGPEAKQNSRISSGAMSREQAAEVFNYASKCILLSPKLSAFCKIIPSSKTIVGLPMNVTYRAVSADADTAHGGSNVVVILDEVGRIKGPRSDFVDAMITSQASYSDPLLIYISTQSPTDGDLFSILIDDATNNKTPKTVCHVYEADEDCDLLDEKQWKKANPALGLFRSYDDMKKQAENAYRMPSSEGSFRNLNLNQRINSESAFVSKSVWEANGTKPEDMRGKKVWGGLDLSAVSDLTALVLASEDGDVEPIFWLPKVGLVEKSKTDRVPYDLWAKQGFLRTCPGKAIEYEYIAKELRRVFNEYDVQQINFDRYAIKFLRPWLVKEGFTEKELDKFKEFGQGFVSMGQAIKVLEAKLLQNRLKHGNHPVLTMCAGNAVIEVDAAGNRKFTKKKSTGRIDGMVSLAMAVDALALIDNNPKKDWSLHFV